MKALSIQQPWGWLIVNGYKDIENRKWETRFRGEFLVHVGKKFDHKGYHWLKANTGIKIPGIDEFPMGGIIGSAELVDCVTSHKSKWFFGPYGFVLKNARPLKFVRMNGRLGFFTVEEASIE